MQSVTDLDRLRAWLEGRLQGAELAALERELQRDPALAELAERLRDVFALTAAEAEPPPCRVTFADIERQLAWRGCICEQSSIGTEHGSTVGIAQCIAARNLDIFVTRAADDREAGGDRDSHIAAHIEIAHALIEIVDILLIPAGRNREAHREWIAGPCSGADLTAVGH